MFTSETRLVAVEEVVLCEKGRDLGEFGLDAALLFFEGHPGHLDTLKINF